MLGPREAELTLTEGRYHQVRRMFAAVAQAMEEGALGLSSALIYVPGLFASTDELVALARVAARYGGSYITHQRDEGDDGAIGLDASMDEVFRVAREAQMRVQHAFPQVQVNGHVLDPGGNYKWRADGEYHLFNPESIHRLQKSVRTGSFATRLKIAIPSALVKVAGEPTVEFRATIQEAVIAKSPARLVEQRRPQKTLERYFLDVTGPSAS